MCIVSRIRLVLVFWDGLIPEPYTVWNGAFEVLTFRVESIDDRNGPRTRRSGSFC